MSHKNNNLEYYEEIFEKFDKEAFPDKKEQQKGFTPYFFQKVWEDDNEEKHSKERSKGFSEFLGVCKFAFCLCVAIGGIVSVSSCMENSSNDDMVSYMNGQDSKLNYSEYTCIWFGKIDNEKVAVLIPANHVRYSDNKTYLYLSIAYSNDVRIPLSGDYLVVGSVGGINSYDLALGMAQEFTDDTYKIYDYNEFFRKENGFDNEEELSFEDVSKVLRLKNN